MSGDQNTNSADELFGTGAVVSMTGLSAARIRMWEKRYGVATPLRTGSNRRLYTRDDLERLQLLKRLTDSGHAIGLIANYPLDNLRSLATEISSSSSYTPKLTGNVIAITNRSGELFANAKELTLVGRFPTLEDALADSSLSKADILYVETDTIFEQTLDQSRDLSEQCEIGRIIVSYRFAPRDILESLSDGDGDIVVIKGVPDAKRLKRECLFQLDAFNSGDLISGPIPERLFSAAQLARLEQIKSSVDCECPHHLAELLKGLTAFEAYSERCEDRNSADAVVHAHLHRSTAHARRKIEESLKRLLIADGIDIGEY